MSLIATCFDLSTSHIISKKSGRVITKLEAFKALMSRFSSKYLMRYFFASSSLTFSSFADIVLPPLISFHSRRFVGLAFYTISFATAALISSISAQSKSAFNGRSSFLFYFSPSLYPVNISLTSSSVKWPCAIS
jgi:hypothetical protein